MELSGRQVMEIQSVISRMDQKSREELVALLPQEEIRIIKKPEAGLLMMTAKDSFNTDFYLGEILVTKAGVEYKGLKGYAMVMGDEPEKALLAASVEAILQAGKKDLIRRMTKVISERSKEINERDELERRFMAGTTVSFQTMVKG